MSKIVSIILFISFILIGCSNKSLVKKRNQESAFIVFKTPNIQYADMGFIYKGDSFVKVDIYAMGQPIMSLDINGMNICMSTFKCMDRKDFNAKMLSDSYPDDILENIFKSQPIFRGENLKRTKNGFTQHIAKKAKYDIRYSVDKSKTIFKDNLNGIIIKINRDIQ
jgi:hypothetical protein